ncbi:MAG: polysaccharide biosynthesis/export family protein [Desulfobacteraceae bacterium]|jgi:polysaccharide export outer membrane protein
MKKYHRLAFGLLLTVSLSIVPATSAGIAEYNSKNAYVVGPGDVLDIQVWDHDDLSRTVEISQEGIFTFPFVGPVDASNLSIFQIERLLTQKLSDGYLVAPQVSITVAEYRNQKVFLLGQVAKPGSYVLRQRNHLLELISEAGGFTAQRGTTCTIVRPEAKSEKELPKSIRDAKKSEIIRINLDKLISGAVDASQFIVMPGDTIYIGESEKIYVVGEVMSPGRFNWEKGLTLREAVSMAGGGTPRASIDRICIIRKHNGKEKTIKPKLWDPVQPNDIIKVPESYF